MVLLVVGLMGFGFIESPLEKEEKEATDCKSVYVVSEVENE